MMTQEQEDLLSDLRELRTRARDIRNNFWIAVILVFFVGVVVGVLL